MAEAKKSAAPMAEEAKKSAAPMVEEAKKSAAPMSEEAKKSAAPMEEAAKTVAHHPLHHLHHHQFPLIRPPHPRHPPPSSYFSLSLPFFPSNQGKYRDFLS